MFKCGFDNEGICKVLNVKTIKNCHCPFYKETIDTCALCGKPIVEAGIIDGGELYCVKCGMLLGTCDTCRHMPVCTFVTDPSPVPKVIQQSVKQGNMIASMPVKNPNRIEITCKKGCECWNDEYGCMREVLRYCDAWEK